MSQTPDLLRDCEPNNPALFQLLFRRMSRLAIEHGIGFPAIDATEEELANIGAFVDGGLPPVYSTAPCMPEYLEANKLRNDSRSTKVRLLGGQYGDKDEATITVLGEGPSIKYGEFGRVMVADDKSLHLQEFVLYANGVVLECTGKFNTDDCLLGWDPVQQATDSSLQTLANAVTDFEHAAAGKAA